MKNTGTQLIAIFAASSIVATATNAVRPTSLPWIRPVRQNDPIATNQEKTTRADSPASGSRAEAAEPQPAANAKAAQNQLSADDVLNHLKNGSARFVDARENHEWEVEHFRGAIHIPASAIYANIDRIVREVPPHEKIIVYCGGGDCEASHHVAGALSNDFKYQDVIVYLKGWQEVDANRTAFTPYIAKGAE